MIFRFEGYLVAPGMPRFLVTLYILDANCRSECEAEVQLHGRGKSVLVRTLAVIGDRN